MMGRERLIDHLRFGEMAMAMRGWTEPMRMSLCERMADGLIRSELTKMYPDEAHGTCVDCGKYGALYDGGDACDSCIMADFAEHG